MRLLEKLPVYGRLMRLDKPIGIYLLIWPMLWALWIAGNGYPNPVIVLIFLVGALLMRSAGCVINDFADRRIDGQVERTRERPLASGEAAPWEALLLFAVLLAVALLLVLQLNPLTLKLAFLAAGLAVLYPFMKRFTHLPQLFLGFAFAWSIPMAFAALTEAVPGVAWLLWLATVAWVVAYDTMYAMVDHDDDLRIGVKSTAILFGCYDRLIIGLLQLIMLGLLAIAGWQLDLGFAWYGGLAGAAVLASYQQWLLRERERAACFRAFLNNNYTGALVFAGLLLDYALS